MSEPSTAPHGEVEAPAIAGSSAQAEASSDMPIVAEASSSTTPQPAAENKNKRQKPPPPTAEEIETSLIRRVTTIKEGDNVLLRLPSDAIKAVVASREGLVQLGKYGSFPSWELIGLHYDITYEIAKHPEGTIKPPERAVTALEDPTAPAPSAAFGQKLGKKAAKKSKKNNKKEEGEQGQASWVEGGDEKFRSNPAWQNYLRPLKRRPVVEAVLDDIQETNEFIDDDNEKMDLLSHEEIAELKKQGISAAEMIERQMERHEKFALKTDFSKEKWRKRKEKKFSQTVLPLAPSVANITTHYLTRSPASTLYLREDTISQLLTHCNVRPDGRYLVVDDTGGLVTAALMDRMGCHGRILTFTDSDSPPAWGVLSVMNFSAQELACVKWLTWLEADEDYVKPPPPDEEKENLPGISETKTAARLRKHAGQVRELNETRNELHTGGWDGLILATELNPISVIARLTPYILGSGTITVYSPYQQVLAETLQYMKRDPNYLSPSLSESWMRTYQVLPGRTHPMMSTSATGGYLLHCIRVHPSTFQADSYQRHPKRRPGKKGDRTAENSATATPRAESVTAEATGSKAEAQDVEMV
ncbi:putative eukaryotic translation initiation factor 3 62 kDa subunit [Papiliotrema laurentii]|uniref:tRNA (adenine(58)-N(1))-methyltransferase non-catalytic subunit TRM6 n=1 Tax=Papiliotrema laurentii TaxID=5418 RepID=A0AAD9CW12_PAPLA|nr:putative eukaryotic translation initiation factor 3 62 kDa subunit [Papiliotrema laurentii]